MKISKILYTILIFLMIVIMINPYQCYAANEIDGGGGGDTPSSYEGSGGSGSTSTTITGNSNKGLPTLDDGYRPKAELGSAQSMVVTILSILTVLGIVAVVIGIALIGFGSILGSAGEKAEYQHKLVGVVIAASIITGGSILAKFIISVAETI